MAEKKVKELTNKTEKTDKVNTELQGKLASSFIQNEIKQAKLEGEIEVIQSKLKTERSITTALRSDLENLEMRYKSRNDIILDYDKRMKAQVLEINNLNDEILSLKLHACRVNDNLLIQESDKTVKVSSQKETVDKINEKSYSQSLNNHHSTTIVRDKSIQRVTDAASPIIIDETESGTSEKETPELLETGSRPGQRKQVLLIGTSNIRYLNARYMAGRNAYVKKITKYTTEEAMTFIQHYDMGFSSDLIVFQLGCNDIGGERNQQKDFSDDMSDLVSATNLKFPGVNVIVSLGLPRGERFANTQVIDQSNKLMSKFKKNNAVLLCDNSRLFFNKRPSKGVLRDEKHLSRKGTTILSQNIKRAIENAFL